MTRNIYQMIIPSMKSLLAHNHIDKIYILTEDDDIGIDLPNICEIINVSNQQYIKTSSPNYQNKLTYMVLMRMALPMILYDEDKILSLDLDTIIQDNIEELWDLSMDNKYIAGVAEIYDTKLDNHQYINCGVLMLNLLKLRDGTAQNIIDLLNINRYKYNEQDCMNIVIPEDKKLIISPIYNYNLFNGNTEAKPKILHFALYGKHFNDLSIVKQWRNKEWIQYGG